MSRFEPFQGRYREEVEASISFVTRDLDLFTEVKARALLEVARRHLGDPRALSALDLGCGTGITDARLASDLGALAGVDPLPGMIETAARANPGVDYQVSDGHKLPFGEPRFDLVFAINVLHHVPEPDREATVREAARVTRPGGLVVVMEHNPFNPLTRLAVGRCPMDEGVTLLRPARIAALLRGAGLDPVERRYLVFFPWRGRRARALEDRLGGVPLGAQYLVAGRRS